MTLVGRAGSTVSLGTTLIIPIDDSLRLRAAAVRELVAEPLPSADPVHRRLRQPRRDGGHPRCRPRRCLRRRDEQHRRRHGCRCPATVRALLASAQSYYAKGLAALKNEDLATYYDDMQMVGKLIAAGGVRAEEDREVLEDGRDRFGARRQFDWRGGQLERRNEHDHDGSAAWLDRDDHHDRARARHDHDARGSPQPHSMRTVAARGRGPVGSL